MTTTKAKHGEKMIQLRVRFFTNNLTDAKDTILPKHMHERGTVSIAPNDAHGIKPNRCSDGVVRSNGKVNFNTLAELPTAIEKVIRMYELTVHDRHGSRMP